VKKKSFGPDAADQKNFPAADSSRKFIFRCKTTATTFRQTEKPLGAFFIFFAIVSLRQCQKIA
jgi:hypothetical protein